MKIWDTSQLNKDININVDKAVFRDKWLKYYLSIQDLAESTAQKLRDNVDNVSVGGTNYASNGDFEIDINQSLWKSNYTGQVKEVVDISTEKPPHQYAYHVKNTTNANGGIFTPIVWDGVIAEEMIDKEITVSFWLKYQNIVQGTNTYNKGRFGEIVIGGGSPAISHDGDTVQLDAYGNWFTNHDNDRYVYTPNTSFKYVRVHVDNTPTETLYFTGTDMTWKKYSATIKLNLPTNTTKLSRISFKHGLEGCTGEFWTTGLKIEIGNRVTDWSQSPLDLTPTQIASSISVTPSAIDLISQNINLTGNVTFESLNSTVNSWKMTGKTTIDGANIETGSISADRIKTGELIVGTNVTMGSNAYISWDNINGDKPNTTYINADGIYTGIITADNIVGGTITGVTFKTSNTSSNITISNDMLTSTGSFGTTYLAQGRVQLTDPFVDSYAMEIYPHQILFSGNGGASTGAKIMYDKATDVLTIENTGGTINFSGNVTGINTTAKFA